MKIDAIKNTSDLFIYQIRSLVENVQQNKIHVIDNMLMYATHT